MVTTRRQGGVSTEREKWDKVFNGLLNIVTELQKENQTLLRERKSLEDLLTIKHQRWALDVHLLQDQIFEIKQCLEGKEKELVLAACRCDLLTVLKHREASFCKLKLEHTVDELADFVTLVDYLELASETSTQNSALSKEKGTAWHQYNTLERILTDKLKNKQNEVEQANEKIAKLLETVEVLQSSNNEKDELILSLKKKVTDMEAETNRWQHEVSGLSTELELLRKSRGTQASPVLKHCGTGTKTSTIQISKSRVNAGNITVKKESTPAKAAVSLKAPEKASRSSKRKRTEVIVISDSPKLFTSAFKVPKLKISTPG